MTLADGKCDSCGAESPVLLPIGLIDQLPSGGMAMVEKWYCVECMQTMADTLEIGGDDDDDDDDEDHSDDEPDPQDDHSFDGIREYCRKNPDSEFCKELFPDGVP